MVTAATTAAFALLQKLDYKEQDATAPLSHLVSSREATRSSADTSSTSDKYVVMLHNDEEHTFDEASSAVWRVRRCARREAEEFAKDAHKSGRSMVCVDARDACMLAQAIILEMELEARVQRLEVVQEQYALVALFSWLAEVTALHPTLRNAAVGVILPHHDAMDVESEGNVGGDRTPLTRLFEVWSDLPERDRDALRDAALSPLLLSPETKLRFGIELFRAYPTVQALDNALTTWSVQVRL